MSISCKRISEYFRNRNFEVIKIFDLEVNSVEQPNYFFKFENYKRILSNASSNIFPFLSDSWLNVSNTSKPQKFAAI